MIYLIIFLVLVSLIVVLGILTAILKKRKDKFTKKGEVEL